MYDVFIIRENIISSMPHTYVFIDEQLFLECVFLRVNYWVQFCGIKRLTPAHNPITFRTNVAHMNKCALSIRARKTTEYLFVWMLIFDICRLRYMRISVNKSTCSNYFCCYGKHRLLLYKSHPFSPSRPFQIMYHIQLIGLAGPD